MGRLEIGSGEGSAQPMLSHHFVYPGKPLEVVLIEQARLRRTQSGQDAGRIPAEDGTIRHVCQARDRKRPRPHPVRKIVAGGRLRRYPGRPPVRMDINRNGFAQDVKRGRGGFGRLSGSCGTTRSGTAAEHRAERGQYRTPHPISTR